MIFSRSKFIYTSMKNDICGRHLAEKSNCFEDFSFLTYEAFKKKHINGSRWSMPGLKINKITKIIYGNRGQNGYRFPLWNCGRGLLSEDVSVKLIDIKQFIEAKHPHCFGIVESDLFGLKSDLNRKKYTTE